MRKFIIKSKSVIFPYMEYQEKIIANSHMEARIKFNKEKGHENLFIMNIFEIPYNT